MGVVTAEDLWKMRDSIVEEMREGFSGIHARQNITNGRINEGEVQGERHATKIERLEATIYARRYGDRDMASAVLEPEQRGITRRDVQMFSAGGTALTALVVLFWKVLPFLLKALHP